MANFTDIIISALSSNAAIAWTSKKPLVDSSTSFQHDNDHCQAALAVSEPAMLCSRKTLDKKV